MIRKKSLGDKTFDLVNILFLSLLMLITSYPFLYVVLASLSEAAKLQIYTGPLIHSLGFSTKAYVAVLKNPAILNGYKNTLFLVAAGTALNVFITAQGAFALSRKSFLLKKPITLLIIFTMFFSGGLIPSYLIVTKFLGLGNMLWACILPGLINTWNFMIMRTYFYSIPDSLEESAKLDGANDIVILFKVILPLCGPIIAVMVLYYGVAQWNQWFSAMIYLTDRSKYPLQLVLREILIANSTADMVGNAATDFERASIGETIKYATIVVATVPILCVYPLLQKYFVKGVMVGAIKG